MEKIEVYELVIDTDDESGVTAIALVDQPAIESNWMAFNKNVEHKFEIKDEEKRIIEGYFMISDLLIPRVGEDGKKFFVKFTAKTIEAIREKMSKLGNTNNFNLMHDPRQIAEGVFMLDNLIIDNERGKVAPKEFDKVPNGSLWGSAKVDNNEIWEQVKSGEFRGFSVEGMFKQLEPVKVDEDIIEQIRESIQNFEKSIGDTLQLSNNKTINNMSMKVIEDLKAILFKGEVKEVVETPETVVEKFVSAELADGTMINIEPELGVDAIATIEVDGEVKPLPPAEYILADGTAFVVEVEGVIASVKEVEVEEAPEDMETAAAPAQDTPTEAKIRKIIESVETVFTKIEALKKENVELKEAFTSYKEEAEVKEKAMFEAVVEIAGEPSKEPVKKVKSGFGTTKKTNIFLNK